MTATYDCIATTTLGSDTASVTFSSISGSFTDLVLVVRTSTSTNANRALQMTFNNDTGTNYSVTRLYGDGTTASSDRFTNQAFIDAGFMPGSNGTDKGTAIIQIMNYSNTTTNKTVLDRWESEASASGSRYTAGLVGLWRSTSAINEIDLLMTTGNLTSGSTFTLYGIKAE